MNFSSSLLFNTIRPATITHMSDSRHLPWNPHECVHLLPPCGVHFLVLFQSITTGHLWAGLSNWQNFLHFFYLADNIAEERHLPPLLALRPSEMQTRATILMLVVLMDFYLLCLSFLSSEIFLSVSLSFVLPLLTWICSCLVEPSLSDLVASG